MRAHGVVSQYKPLVAAPPVVDDTVLFLCSFEGGNGDTSATDDSTYAHPITFLSQAQISTAQVKFGSSSLEVSTGGGSSGVTIPDHAVFDFGSNPFTVEGFVRPNSVVVSQVLAAQADFAGTDVAWQVSLSGANFRFFYTVDGTTYVQATNFAHGMSAGSSFYHWAVARHSDNILRAFIDGVLKATVDLTGITFHNSSQVISFGSLAGGSLFTKGFHDEIRVLNYAAYTAAFTPPSSPFPRP